MLVVRKTKRYMTFLSLVLVFVVILSTDARAVIYGFEAISDNSGVSSLMAQQLSLEVTPYGTTGHQVLFAFKNNIDPYAVGSPINGIIGSVFFEDGVLLTLEAILDDGPLYPGVDFKVPDNPESKNFPEGGNLVPPFQTTAHFWATTDTAIDNGVNLREKVGIVFDIGSNTFANVLTAIGLGFTDPDPDGNTSLRIGVHVQNLPHYYDVESGEWTGSDRSDSFILTPVPGAVVLGILGLCVAGLKLRKYA